MEEKRGEDVRDGVADADATGMIAGEELITQAETLLPLHAEIESDAPDRDAIDAHVQRLRALPELEARIANWWEDPSTQRFVWNLSQIGL